MKSCKAIAEETGTTIEQVHNAMACAGKTRGIEGGLYAADWPGWCVSAAGVGSPLFWIHAQGWGETREEAVIEALTNHAELF